MSKKKKRSDDPVDEQVNPLIPAEASYLAAVLFACGIAALYFLGRNGQDAFTWKNYLAIALVVCSAILWFVSGMDRSQVIEWVRSGLIALLLALTIRWAVAEPYRIPSGSMETALHGDPRFGRGDRVFVNKFIFGLRYPFLNKRIWRGKLPERWDIVVFKTVEKDAIHKTLVKRVVGLPGEEIQIRNGRVYADGVPLTVPESVGQDIYFTTPLDGPWGVQSSPDYSQIPPDHYLLLGDNSAHSRDGRYFGWVPNNHLVGRVSGIWWPPPRWRDFTGFTGELWWRSLITLLGGLILLRLFVGRICTTRKKDFSVSRRHLVSFLNYGLLVPVVQRRILSWRKPGRGDLVLFKVRLEDSKEHVLLIGRIAGTEKEAISFREGKLHIDDTLLDSEPFASRSYEMDGPDIKYGKVKSKDFSRVPEGAYYILSDDAAEKQYENDSRTLGWISQGDILGKVLFSHPSADKASPS
ncbi:MAG: signal peptidase I [Candidatus Hydrogenedens sp.]|jgi:signal peptidase I|nr:signal peptidase I [Candidatus Hydrogenedens sp.]